MANPSTILTARTPWTLPKGEKIWNQKKSPIGWKECSILLGKSGGQLLIAPERMKHLGQRGMMLSCGFVWWCKSERESEVAQLCLTLCNPMDCSQPGSAVYGDSSGKNTGKGCHALLQGIFQTQRLNQNLLHWQAGSLPVVPPGKPIINYNAMKMHVYVFCIYIGFSLSWVVT